MSTAVESKYVTLDWQDEEGNVVVAPRDHDRFVIKMRRAISMLQLADKVDQFNEQFQVLVKLLVKWLRDREDIAEAYITLRDGSLAFVVERKEAEYNEQFEDELSALDYSIANDADLELIKLDVMGLPPVSEEAMESFLDPAFLLSFAHGKRSRSHSTSE